ncbi:hypothetical protein G6F46_007903 [Rhizopus delemar]|uniref:Methyltransferase domain-containing protein n=2 Tax=Rhizopus TaxID=4842 RepID=A0A9P7CUR4_9FUNG|nr:hypothetical protein G6F43_010139 [Rhizopus delemar]KAG1552361.1 hypothetical protein G6F51_001272 [Rhizopus arrhizus]KAG1459871.1 hypothetical protein G6F55_004504 [Rhizopus delemar]KAG1493888.1 hypothetical protein G6F54_008269 [Rhizopus delemar]KAG1509157.1 hypothetical protein G6F53_007655 [Rhizopus delemar]
MGNKLTKEQQSSDNESKEGSSSETSKAMTKEILSELRSKTTIIKDTTIESGREFHTEETSTYWLPKDDEEQQRLTGQHFAVKELYGGSNLLPSVEKALDFNSEISILDIGCGSGIWVMDMITDYPNCKYYGCDMVDTTNKNIRLPQFEFAIGNVLKGLPYEDNTFDLVHMRLFVFALREDQWPIVIKELVRVAKPGCIVQVTEVDLKMPNEDLGAYHKLLVAIHAVCEQRSQNPRIALELEKMMLENTNTEVLQTEYRTCVMNCQSSTAKKFIWDWIELSKGMLSHIGPILGLNTNEEQKEFIHELRRDLSNLECLVHFNAIAAKKL